MAATSCQALATAASRTIPHPCLQRSPATPGSCMLLRTPRCPGFPHACCQPCQHWYLHPTAAARFRQCCHSSRRGTSSRAAGQRQTLLSPHKRLGGTTSKQPAANLQLVCWLHHPRHCMTRLWQNSSLQLLLQTPARRNRSHHHSHSHLSCSPPQHKHQLVPATRRRKPPTQHPVSPWTANSNSLCC